MRLTRWKMQGFDPGEVLDRMIADPEYVDHDWLETVVPGDVHAALLARGLIPDPFVGHNDQLCRWVEEKVWWFRTEVEMIEELQDDERMELIFGGLDTFATVYVNGHELGRADNMFVAHVFDVTRVMCRGRNVVAVKFDPVSRYIKDKTPTLWAAFNRERPWVRKAQMNFGWDWAPRLVTVGMWQDVTLERRRRAVIESVFPHTRMIRKDHAVLDVTIEVRLLVPGTTVEVDVELIGEGCHVRHTVPLTESGTVEAVLTVPEPKLWWTHDLGEPYLYQLIVRLRHNGEILDERVQDVGIRTVKVRRYDEATGEARFTFVLNGVEVFAKGANWVPVDSLIGAAPEERYVHLIALAKEANMNMLRVWGGGIYERDVFYRECDRQGILVWQDFMFACALYPDFHRDFVENVRREIVYVVKRLRSHPCLALWCGNNENDWIYEKLRSAGQITSPFYGESLYHELIPRLLAELDPTRDYWPSSPYGGNDHNSAEEGDRHNWQVWHGDVEPRRFGEPPRVDRSVEGVSFKNYERDTARFVSEFGMHASANRYTLQRYIPQNQWFLGSPELAYRNKDVHPEKGRLLLEGYTGQPCDLDTYIAYSMLTQAEGLRFGIEHYRRRKPATSGALIWQLNDCWPGTSWSLIDYCRLPKASYYYVRDSFAPVLLSLRIQPGTSLEVWVVNDRREAFTGHVRLEAFHVRGERLFALDLPVAVEANGVRRVAVFAEQEVLRGCPAEEAVVCLSADQPGVLERRYLLRDQKAVRLPNVRLVVTVDRSSDSVHVATDGFARFVWLELPAESVVFSDNFFDLLPGERRTVRARRLDGGVLPWEALRVWCLNGEVTVKGGERGNERTDAKMVMQACRKENGEG